VRRPICPRLVHEVRPGDLVYWDVACVRPRCRHELPACRCDMRPAPGHAGQIVESKNPVYRTGKLAMYRVRFRGSPDAVNANPAVCWWTAQRKGATR
jgi:hypothetical protein